MKKILAATLLMVVFFLAGVRFCVMFEHIEIVGRNGEDFVYTVEVFGREDFGFAEWNPLPVNDVDYGMQEVIAYV